MQGSRARASAFDALLLATGAAGRLLPVPGRTVPGVFSPGGAQTVLKDQGAVIGRRVVFAGASPLLYLAALQYHAMGVNVAAVLDTTRFTEKLRAVPQLVGRAPAVLLRSLSYLARMRAGGVSMLHGVSALGIEGEAQVEGVHFRDAAALGFGLRAETQLLDLASTQLTFDETHRQWLPVADPDGRVALGLHAAGDAATSVAPRPRRSAGALRPSPCLPMAARACLTPR